MSCFRDRCAVRFEVRWRRYGATNPQRRVISFLPMRVADSAHADRSENHNAIEPSRARNRGHVPRKLSGLVSNIDAATHSPAAQRGRTGRRHTATLPPKASRGPAVRPLQTQITKTTQKQLSVRAAYPESASSSDGAVGLRILCESGLRGQGRHSSRSPQPPAAAAELMTCLPGTVATAQA